MKSSNSKDLSNNSFFKRCDSESQHPFVMLPRALIVDANISPQCRWLISYLLALPPTQTISVPQVYREQGLSKDRIYPMINEAIQHGYLKRDTWLEEGKKRYCYTVSQEPKFKNVLLCRENQDAEQCRENQDTETCLKQQISLAKSVSKNPQGERECKDRGYRGKEREGEGASRVGPKTEGGDPPEWGGETPPQTPPPLGELAPRTPKCDGFAAGSVRAAQDQDRFVQGPIHMAQSDYDKLIALHGPELIAQIAEDMTLYSHTHPREFKRYGSHYHVFLTWIRRRKKQEADAESRRQSYRPQAKENPRIVRGPHKTVADEEAILRKAMEDAGCYTPQDIEAKIDELYELRGVSR